MSVAGEVELSAVHTHSQDIDHEEDVDSEADPMGTTAAAESDGDEGQETASVSESTATQKQAAAAPAPAAPPPQAAPSTMSASVVNLTTNILGAGLLSMPWAVRMSSLLAGLLGLFVMSVANTYSFHLLACSCKLSRSSSYKQIATRAYGATFGYAVQAITGLYSLGSCVGLVTVIQDFLPKVVNEVSPDSNFQGSTLVMVAIGAFILFPLSSVRDLNALRYTSVLAILGILFTVGMIVASEVAFGHASRTTNWSHVRPTNLFVAWPLFIVAFTAHYNAPKFFAELAGPAQVSGGYMRVRTGQSSAEGTYGATKEGEGEPHGSGAGAAAAQVGEQRPSSGYCSRLPRESPVSAFSIVATAAVGACLALYIVAGTCAVLRFGRGVTGNVLDDFAVHSALAATARVALMVAVTCAYPLMLNCSRNALHAVVFGERAATSSLLRVGETLLVVAVTIVIAVLIPQIEVVYAYKGALLGSLVVYILPAVMYIALLPPSTRRLRTLAAPVLLALFGALSLVLGTYGAILHTRGGLPSEGTVTNKLL